MENIGTDQAKLRKMRANIFGLYSALNAIKERYGLKSCTINDLIALRWSKTSEEAAGLSEAEIDANISADQRFVAVVCQILANDGEGFNADLALNSDIDIISHAIGKITMAITPYPQDFLQSFFETRTSGITSSQDYEAATSSFLGAAFDEETKMLDVHERNYLKSLLFMGNISTADYNNQIEILNQNIEELRRVRQAIEATANEKLKAMKASEKKGERKGFFKKLLSKKSPSETNDEK